MTLKKVELTYKNGGYRVTFVEGDPKSALVERFVAESCDRKGKHRPAHYRTVRSGDTWYAVAEMAAAQVVRAAS